MELPRYGPLKKATGAGEQCRGQGSKLAHWKANFKNNCSQKIKRFPHGTEIILGIA